jgi:uncharacterized protein
MRTYAAILTTFHRAMLVLVSLLLTDAVSAHSTEPATFTDSLAVTLFSKGVKLGTGVSTLGHDGAYRRTFTIQAGEQRLEMQMTILPDEHGGWKEIVTENAAFGNRRAERQGNAVRVEENGVSNTIPLPDHYILFDDFGNLWESVMLAKYDMAKRGPQRFTRFRIPESPMPGNSIVVEVEYAGERQRAVNGEKRTFRLFEWRLAGQQATYWVDSVCRIMMVDSPVEQSVAIREGFEDLLKPASHDSTASSANFELERRTLSVPMRDGVWLVTDVYLPRGGRDKFPLVLLRTPYNRKTVDMEFGARYYASHGYAVAVQDVRGRFESGGTWVPFLHEAEDGYDAIEYLATQEWCNGRVGMLGGSYLAWAQFWAAKLKPPHLVTIIPHNVPSDPFRNSPYEHGVFLMTPQLWWTAVVEAGVTDLSHPKFKEVEAIKHDERLASLPVVDLDRKIFGREIPYWRDWISHNSDDSYWDRARFLDGLKGLEIPVFLVSGWYDTQSIGTKHAWQALTESRSAFVKLIMGPWNHLNQVPKTAATKRVGSEAVIDLPQLYLRWFDRWLKGKHNGIDQEPRVQLYVLNAQRWIMADAYPEPRSGFRKLCFSSTRGANTLRGDGKLRWDEPGVSAEADSYIYSPSDPTPAPASRFTNGRKSFDEITSTRQDILVYESEPLEQTLTVAGPIQATIFASSSVLDTDWFVTLYALTDAGQHVQMVRGAVRARFRNSMRRMELLDPGRVYKYTIDLWHFGLQLEKGWKLRAEITSAYFPEFSRNLNTGGDNEMENEWANAHQRIYHSTEYPSHLLLPIVE